MIPAELLLRAYASGWFPMAVEGGGIEWFSPDPRGILPLDGFSVSSRLRRTLRQGRFEIRFDTAFERVMRECAARDDTWISDEIVESYVALFRMGFAHSVEAWQGADLTGGLYGVALAGAFFGESMFHKVPDASKVALCALVERLRAGGFTLLDIQWTTPHLEQFGAVDVTRRRYLGLLARALEADAHFT